MAAHSPITVDLRVNVDASGLVTVLDVAADTHNNAVICTVELAANSLFDVSFNSVFEMWEPVEARNTLLGAVAQGTGAHAGSSVSRTTPNGLDDRLRLGLDACLAGPLDATAAPIFSAYSGNADYTTQANIGELALAYAAHTLFGHVAATAAITNDTVITGYINGTGAGQAALGAALKDAIVTMSSGTATAIVNSVIGQDATRARDEDNSAYPTDVAQSLRFYAGDVVFVAITMTGWSVGVGAATAGINSAAVTDQVYIGENAAGSIASQQFFFRILLE